MKKDSWIVEPDTRYQGDKKCFYCNAPVGSEHKEDCVQRKRTVVIRATLEIVVTEPESFGPYSIEHFYNEGSWCADNIVGMIDESVNRMGEGCMCGRNILHVSYVREATPEDERNCNLYIAEVKQG